MSTSAEQRGKAFAVSSQQKAFIDPQCDPILGVPKQSDEIDLALWICNRNNSVSTFRPIGL